MSILEAAQQKSVLSAALHYVEEGLSVLPVKGKINAVKWAKFQVERPTPGLVHWWHEKDLLSGVGIICGRVSGNLVVIDLDGTQAVDTFELTFPHLLNTFAVLSGSGKGKHYYYFTDQYTPTTRTQGFEVRSDGCYVVAPPSIHVTSCLAYSVVSNQEVKRVPDLNEVHRWIVERIKTQARRNHPPQTGRIIKATAYAQSALNSECSNVRLAGEGNANNALYLAALKMGNLVKLQHIGRTEVEDALLAAAASLSARDGEIKSYRTILSGLNTGIAKGQR